MKRSSPRVRRALRRGAIAAAAVTALAAAWIIVLWFTLPDVRGLAARNPRTTALIEQRRAEAAREGRRFTPRQVWVPLNRISPRVVHAVILSEDAKFFGHEGFDWEAIRDAAEKGIEQGHFSRGGSTITQQLAKNLYLGTERTLTRKVKEALLAVKLERALSKRRILALYLNVIEWGPGTFGVEAASRRWFGTSAASVDTAEAAVLASMLPAPRKAALAPAPRWLSRRARRCVARLRAGGRISASEQAFAVAELERILAGESGSDDDPPSDDAPAAPATGPAVAGRGSDGDSAPDPVPASEPIPSRGDAAPTPASPLPSSGAD